jgi:hypothetical protein
MKDGRIFKSLAALSLDGHAVAPAPPPAPGASPPIVAPDAALRDGTTNSNDFRAMLYERSTAPFALSSPYRHFGINE